MDPPLLWTPEDCLSNSEGEVKNKLEEWKWKMEICRAANCASPPPPSIVDRSFWRLLSRGAILAWTGVGCLGGPRDVESGAAPDRIGAGYRWP